MSRLPPNSLIVITGVTGFIASHIALFALRECHRVRGTVRGVSMHKAHPLRKAFVEQGIPEETIAQNLEIVPADYDDFSSEDKCVPLFNGAFAVVHVALPRDKFLSPDLPKVLMDSTMSMLKAASQVPTLERFVFTSSSAAITLAPSYVDKALSVDDWNEVAIKVMVEGEAVENYPEHKKVYRGMPYAAGKAMSERVGFDFVKRTKPNFQFVSVLPNFTFGPTLGDPATSVGTLLAALKGDKSYTSLFVPQWFVDVRDVAKVHWLALSEEAMSGKRWLAVSEPFGHNQIFAFLRKEYPERPIPEDFEAGEVDRQKFDNSATTQMIGEWIGLEQSIRDSIESFKKKGLL